MMFAGTDNDFTGGGTDSWNSGPATGKPASAPPRKGRATNAPDADGSFQIGGERQQFLVGVRRLAHALDGVKILQRLDAGQRLRLATSATLWAISARWLEIAC